MPAQLLESQFIALEEPITDGRPIVVDIDASVDRIADRIIEDLERDGSINPPDESVA